LRGSPDKNLKTRNDNLNVLPDSIYEEKDEQERLNSCETDPGNAKDLVDYTCTTNSPREDTMDECPVNLRIQTFRTDKKKPIIRK